ncbi:MAG: extracellular solute-binding protein [Parvibaculaceae bacterium]
MAKARIGARLHTRRSILTMAGGIAAASFLGAPSVLRAQQREIVIGGAASHLAWMQKIVIPHFEQKHQVKVTFEGARSMVNLEKMANNKGKQYLSVVQMDDPVLILAIEQDLLERMDAKAIPNLAKLKPGTIHQDGYWANYLQPWQGIAFNSTAKQQGVPSWEDLWDQANRGRIILPSLQNTEGVANLFMAAHLETGKPMAEAVMEIDAGFERLARMKPNLLTIYTQMPQAFSLLEQGEAWMVASAYSSFVLPRKQEGVPIDLAAPKEGIFASPSGIAKVKGGPNPDLADLYINELLSVDIQSQLVEPTFSLPTNAEVPATSSMPQVEVFPTDWSYVAKNRQAWIEKWDRLMAL